MSSCLNIFCLYGFRSSSKLQNIYPSNLSGLTLFELVTSRFITTYAFPFISQASVDIKMQRIDTLKKLILRKTAQLTSKNYGMENKSSRKCLKQYFIIYAGRNLSYRLRKKTDKSIRNSNIFYHTPNATFG